MNRHSPLTRILPALLLLTGAGVSHADPITINLTGDNEVRVGICTSVDCSAFDALGATANYNDWRISDSLVLDLAAGTHQFLFQVTNWYSFGSGNPAAAYPALRGQYAAYTAKQLRAYASGTRKTDGTTRIMRDIAERLTEEDIDAVASYAQGLHGGVPAASAE